MKKALAIVVCLCLLVQCMAQLMVVGCFELNKKYIAQHLCENRDKPQMKCCGKCYVRKQLKKVDNEDNGSPKSPFQKIDKNEAVAYILPFNTPGIPARSFFPAAMIRTPRLQDLHDGGISPSIFHPPAAAA